MKHYHFDHEVLLYNLGDLHRGDDACDVSLYLKLRDRIAANPHARWVSTGDLLNVALPTSKSSVFESANLGDEVAALSAELAPIADKCLGFVGSNHHNRFDRAVGMSLDGLLAQLLKIPHVGEIGRLAITCGRMSHWVAMHHTTGGGGTSGAKANKQDRLLHAAPCMDVYLAGHTHTFMVMPECQPYPDRKRGRMTKLKQIKVTTGHFLDFDGSYAAAMMLAEKPKGAAVVHLEHANAGNVDRKTYRAWLED